METFTVKIGKSPDEMTFDECMAHIKRVLFWDYIDGEWCDVVPLSDKRWEELVGYIRGAHEREVDALKAENEKLEKRLAQYGLFREVVGDPAHEFASLRRELHRVERENVKLRDLVYSILKCAGEIGCDSGCDKCPMNTDGDLESYLDGTWCKLRSTLREVGIGVE